MNRPRFRKALGPYTRPLVQVVFAGAAIMGLNAGYLALVTILEQVTGNSYQDWFYLYMFLAHVVLGILLMIPVLGMAQSAGAYVTFAILAIYVPVLYIRRWGGTARRVALVFSLMVLFLVPLVIVLSGIDAQCVPLFSQVRFPFYRLF